VAWWFSDIQNACATLFKDDTALIFAFMILAIGYLVRKFLEHRRSPLRRRGKYRLAKLCNQYPKNAIRMD
jgi:hypothetical protein